MSSEALFNAAKTGDLLYIQNAIAADHTILNVVDISGKTLLMWATQMGNLDIVRELLSAGASPLIQDTNGRTAFLIGNGSGNPGAFDCVEEIRKSTTELLLSLIKENNTANAAEFIAAGADIGFLLLKAVALGNIAILNGVLSIINLLTPSQRVLAFNTKDKYGNTAFIKATSKQNLLLLKTILESISQWPAEQLQVIFSEKDKYGITGIRNVVKEGNSIALVELLSVIKSWPLKDQIAIVGEKDKYDLTLLTEAVSSRNVTQCSSLLEIINTWPTAQKKAYMNEKSSSDRTAMMEAVRNNDIAMLNELLSSIKSYSPDEQYEIFNEKNFLGEHILARALKESNLEALKALLAVIKAWPEKNQAGIIHQKNKYGVSFLTEVLSHGNVDFCNAILAVINTWTSEQILMSYNETNSDTPLTLATDKGNIVLLESILSNLNLLSPQHRLAAFKAKNNLNKTALMIAISQNNTTTFNTLLHAVELWPIEQQLEVLNQKDANGNTLLMLAIMKGSNDVVKAVLTNILSWPEKQQLEVLNQRDPNGNTVLMLTAMDGSYDVLKTLCSYMQIWPSQQQLTFLNETNYDGNTPLMLAADRGHTEIINELAQLGAEQSLELNQPYKIIKEIGHLLGLSTSIMTSSGLVNTEGNLKVHSFSLLEQVIESYNLQDFGSIQSAVSTAKKYTEPQSVSFFFERLNKNECTMIPSGWAGHAISLVFHKGYLIVTNRGVKDTNLTKIYKVNKEIDKNDIQLLMNLDNRLSSTEIETHIKKIVGYSDPVFRLPSKAQKHGNCSFVNPKASIEAILFLEKYESLLSDHDEKESERLAREYARDEYKIFTSDMRDQAINRLIEFKDTHTTQKDNEIAIQLAVNIIKAHHGQSFGSNNDRTQKMDEEKARVKQLLNGFDENDRNAILNEIKKDQSINFSDIESILTQEMAQNTRRKMILVKKPEDYNSITPAPRTPESELHRPKN